jgi:hypothetical protein
MIRPFATDPRLSSAYPSPDELRTVLSGATRSVREVVARLWLSEGVPSAFSSSAAVYEDLRGWLASQLGVHPKEVTLIGSARMGYSVAPPPGFGRRFNEQSDLDLSIVSADLFRRVAETFDIFSADYAAGVVVPRSARERELWDENIAFGKRNIPQGFFDPNKVPNFGRYPIAQQVSQAMWSLLKKLEATPGAPRVRKASTRVYRDWESFIKRVSFNLLTATKGAEPLVRADGRKRE